MAAFGASPVGAANPNPNSSFEVRPCVVNVRDKQGQICSSLPPASEMILVDVGVLLGVDMSIWP